MNVLYLHSFKTRIGTVRTAATEQGVALIALPGESPGSFERQIEQRFAGHDIRNGGTHNARAESEIREFLDGRREKFSLPLVIDGTPFQKKVLRRVARIPFGETMSYGDIACAVGHPRACRAVGSVNAGNNLPLVIPCHRVGWIHI